MLHKISLKTHIATKYVMFKLQYNYFKVT